MYKRQEMMVKANIKVIRIGEFAWSLYEPEEGKYEFDWMDEALDFFGKYGIKVVMCTPSATPPKWMIDKYPDILQNDIHGNPKLFGTRKHYCFNSETYREKTKKLNTLIAKRYAKHPAIEAWQVDNELGWSNTTRCYCKSCENRFRNWLKEKYGTIDNLNKTYGTTFWSQIYRSFDELIIPKAGACYDTSHDKQGQNPALLLDYYRFCSDSVIDFTKESVKTIREYSDLPITSNLLDAAINSGTGIDYFKLSKEFDFVTWDNYIEFQWGKAKPETVSRDHALLRSYKKKPFWVMEQQSGPCGWSKMGPTPTPGKLRLWTYQSVANGEMCIRDRVRGFWFAKKYTRSVSDFLQNDELNKKKLKNIGNAELQKLAYEKWLVYQPKIVIIENPFTDMAVSYTHLDVYKRQGKQSKRRDWKY